MEDGLASSNVNRSYSLAATCIAIFTFMLFFLYPRFASGEINPLLFQSMLVVMGVATFALVFASFYYYAASLGSPSARSSRHVSSAFSRASATWSAVSSRPAR